MDNRERFAHIKGWGADLDPADRPAYPKERMPARLPGLHWDEPEQQPVTVKILGSTERDGKPTPVFGTTVPPAGLSGVMRGVAFRYSENDLRHWLILLAADRTNVVEGLIDDLLHGHVPNVLGEMGIRAAWKHDRAAVVRKAAVGAAVLAALVVLATRRKHQR
ncbi:hypothetical protein [Xylophilus ampelinus]|uniref:Uncharacterized protein n=1 Tax=Xylophilus ampelinus TaxID=54067 RepID=A0A318SQR5_9BURK|nr:hypothetical protein [Xylophilus ampelinus]MCS4509224.1 hypothetical protein [Xylophilus ampelinus]PYE79749.1 hypothetical protein DFQ15_10169 [Xylophilus ampelinus]